MADDPKPIGKLASEITQDQQVPNHWWKPGQSGNPAGRPKGSRNKLGEVFIEAMHKDFNEHGADVIERVRVEKPDQYLKVIASILPKELHVTDATLGDMTDEQLIEYAVAVRSALAATSGPKNKRRTRQAPSPQGTEGTGRPN